MIAPAILDSLSFARSHMYDEEPELPHGLNKRDFLKREENRAKAALLPPRVSNSDKLRDVMEPGREYAVIQLSQLSGVSRNSCHAVLSTMGEFVDVRHEIRGRQTLYFFRLKAPKDMKHEVPPGFDATLLAACFPKYQPYVEEEEACI